MSGISRNDMFDRLARLISDIHTIESDLAADSGDPMLTPLQGRILQVLHFSGSKNLSALSRCLHINLPNCSREVKKLATAGLVEKVPLTTDRRVTEVRLSSEGKAGIERSLGKMKAKLFTGLEDWTNEDYDRVATAIENLQNSLIRTLLT